MTPFINCFKKIYIFLIIPNLKNKSVQTDLNCETTSISSQTQTHIIEIPKTRYNDSDTQTDIKLTDIYNDNEWSNLIWSKPDLIDIV